MTGPDPNPETGGRPLAEILREAGIDMSKAARRRRWNDPEWDDPVPQRRATPETDQDSRSNFGRRRSDQADAATPARSAPRPRPVDPSTAAIPNLRPSRRPDVPGSTGPVGIRPDREQPREAERRREPDRYRDPERYRDSDRFGEPERREPERRREPEQRHEPEQRRESEGWRESDGRRGSQRGREPERLPDPGRQSDSGRLRTAERLPEPGPAVPGRSRGRAAQRLTPVDDHPSTGPIPIATDLEDEEVGGRESALAWLRFVGELVIALAAGVGVYFAFTVLWEMLPYVAVIAAPVVVAGLVAGVSMWRTRLGRDPVGGRLLIVLVFAGTLLTIAPAAGLLSGA